MLADLQHISVLRRISANMPRVLCRCPLPVLCILYGLYSFWIVSVFADCWYENDKYEEGVEVATAEACLNCTCSRGALLCYLRVCPKLPDPPPPGCILLHRYRTCCPELICTDLLGGGNGLEGRSESDGLNLIDDTTTLGDACIANGTIYGPGSAMDSSSFCEFCYCLAGRETCVKPKCLLPIEGCTPMYDNNNCCPVHYNCTSLPKTTTSSSTTTVKTNVISINGCKIDDVYYPEGGKVLGVGHSVCDNCYCLRGILRCEPLSCAPPLLGCTPIIRSGECCAASYNCSGTIEIQPEPNYGQYPTVSKEYAKLRKEVQQVRSTTKTSNRKKVVTENTNMPYYVIAESLKSTTALRTPGTFGTTRQFSGVSFNPSTTKPEHYTSKINESLETSENKYSTYNHLQNLQEPSKSKKNFTTENYPEEKTLSKQNKTYSNNLVNIETDDFLGLNDDSLLNLFDALLDVRLNRKVKNETNVTDITTTELPETTTTIDLNNEINLTVVTEDDNMNLSTVTNDYSDNSEETTEPITDTTEFETTTFDEFQKLSSVVTVKTILNSTDCVNGNVSDSNVVEKRHDLNLIEVTTVFPIDANEVNKLAIVSDYLEYSTDASEERTASTAQDDITEVNLESRVKVGSSAIKNDPEIPIEIEAILNITKNKEDDFGEYDYNEPSLPPSLPNLRIIPFVAADALDLKKESAEGNAVYSQERISDTQQYPFPQWFNPPSETEGGFLPKAPPILDKKPNEINCLSQDRVVPHGEAVPTEQPCTICNCYYGNVVCQKKACPIPRPECRPSPEQDDKSCCPQYVCDVEEAPTVVLDRIEGTNPQETVTVAEGTIIPDPFRHVIRTEPAPDLQSLIGDMKPFLTRKTTPIPRVPATENSSTTVQTVKTTTPATSASDTENNEFSLEKVFQLLLSGETDIRETSTKGIQTINNNTRTADPNTIQITTVSPSVSELYNLQSVPVTHNAEREIDSNGVSTLQNNMNKLNKTGLVIAGCNIYGRMYRVERIISELSNPCLECKCTQGGVQCRALNC